MTVITGRGAGGGVPRHSRHAALAAVFALAVGVVLLTLLGTHAVWAYWAASSVVVAGALTLIVTGERIWDHLLTNARAAGVVAPH
ncbi:hypothetical protein [Mycolicibacterium hippocampi]|uniref:Uncharacterized protein n=1 Tax=Mycolicibacterium hippocampi TaxID=659824 RepID=A0A850PVW6_9MYCO|nr:hypothetical protein [Mycolicibacterium hippocampi]NVN52114.1 hypothetical protein [Mycolicibacterium hippocampi]